MNLIPMLKLAEWKQQILLASSALRYESSEPFHTEQKSHKCVIEFTWYMCTWFDPVVFHSLAIPIDCTRFHIFHSISCRYSKYITIANFSTSLSLTQSHANKYTVYTIYFNLSFPQLWAKITSIPRKSAKSVNPYEKK